MAKVLLTVVIAAAAMVVAEPPVNNQYLPPGLHTEANFPTKGGSPNNQYLPPSSQYKPPSGSNGIGFGGRPSSQYGPPSGINGNGFSGKPSGQYGPPSNQYGTPSGSSQNGGYGEGPSEPANYEFKYDVDAPEYTVKFGHQEARQGDVAQGKYYVLLPDGRTQMVEYVADQEGYRPKISYQGGEGGNGYGSGLQGSGSSGYQYRK